MHTIPPQENCVAEILRLSTERLEAYVTMQILIPIEHVQRIVGILHDRMNDGDPHAEGVLHEIKKRFELS